jgi:flagellar hook protein FlgE
MTNAANIALLAINAFDKVLSITANNIANVNTDRFKKSRAVIEEGETSGIGISSERMNMPGDMVTIDGVEHEASNVNLEEELVALMTNQNNYEANLKTVKAADEMRKTLLDIVT